jgi:tetratricopeptide (TPR) repeat protein
MNAKEINIGSKLITIVCVAFIFFLQQTAFTANSFADVDKSLLPAIKFQEQGRYTEAITKYYNIIEKNPKNLKAYYNLAMILEIVLEDYKSAILLYDKAISIAENKIAFFIPGQEGESKEELNNILSKLNKEKEDSIQKMFNSIDGITFPRYIELKSGKKLFSQPFEKSEKLDASSFGRKNEFRFIDIKNNWYRLITNSTDQAWVNGNDIRMIYRNSNERIAKNGNEKAEGYQRFANSFPEHELAKEAEKRMNKLYN